MYIRLDKYVAYSDVGTRKQVQKLIIKGHVKVNGLVQKDASTQIDVTSSFVELDDQSICYRKNVYIIMNKPKGYVSATVDRYNKTVMDILPSWVMRRKMAPVGRLDSDTTGLLMITDDGAFNHFMTAPKRHIDKVYHAQIDKPVTIEHVEAFASGMRLKDFIAEPAILSKAESNYDEEFAARVTIHEGKYHQVKRMFGVLGINVYSLERIAIGDIILPVDMKEGQWREFSAEELRLLKLQNPYLK